MADLTMFFYDNKSLHLINVIVMLTERNTVPGKVWSIVKEGRGGGYHYASVWKEKKGLPENRWLDNIRDETKEYKMTEDIAQNRRVCDMTTMTGPLRNGRGKLLRG